MFRAFFTALALCLLSPAFAAGSKEDLSHNRSEADVVRDPADVRSFVEANLRETLYHELAHAMIDVMDLSVFGPEEFAADMFSTVMLNTLFRDDAAIDMTAHIAAAYLDGVPRDGLGATSGVAIWDLHGTDEQRYYNFICMMYGADPDARFGLIDTYDLPHERAETCEDEYDLTARSWGKALDRISPENAPDGFALKLDWVLDENAPEVKFIKGEIEHLNEVIALPQQVFVSVIPCDEENAFYDPGEREILICTELAAFLADIAPE
ncbi:MAG: DUF4344 domain-containing metallopeptidase [Maritimibacter sp.]